MEDLINRIAEGKAQLLGIEDICTRLGISRSTFDRWQRVSTNSMHSRLLRESNRINNPVRHSIFSNDDDSSMTSFPPPDIRIGNSPKWEIETFKKWLRENVRSS